MIIKCPSGLKGTGFFRTDKLLAKILLKILRVTIKNTFKNFLK